MSEPQWVAIGIVILVYLGGLMLSIWYDHRHPDDLWPWPF